MKRILSLVVMLALSGCASTEQAPVPTNTRAPADTAAPTAIPVTGSTETPVPSPTATVPPAQQATAFPDASAFQWAPVASGFVQPTDIQFADDGSGRMFVLEQPGRIRIVKDGQVAPTPFLDIGGKVRSTGSEQGLLGLAFHPDFAHNPYFYINYTDTNGNTVIARYQASGDSADPNSEQVLIHQDQPFPNHNGGVLAFGPDGYLYAGLGDGGSGGDPFGNGQNTKVLLGKVLRIDVDHGDPYGIPPGNPLGNEIWEYGLRNPWRISFDKGTGDLYIADVGQNAWEELDYVDKDQGGLNFGWNYREGLHAYQGTPPPAAAFVDPVAEYSHAVGGCAITGGYVYRGSMPEWQGIYLYGDYCSGYIWGLLRSNAAGTANGWTSQLLFQTGNNITTFGQDPQGEVYYAGRAGTIYKLQK
jgi:glucose/arabinose dehydrogenase